jgi:hypothetical protein
MNDIRTPPIGTGGGGDSGSTPVPPCGACAEVGALRVLKGLRNPRRDRERGRGVADITGSIGARSKSTDNG